MIKPFLKLTPIICAMLLLSSCAFFGGDDEISYIPVRIDDDGNWGLLGSDGKMLFDNEFKNPISPAVAGVFLEKKENGYTIYKAEATPQPLGGACESLKDVGVPSEKKIVIADKNYRISVISTDGERLFSLPATIVMTQAYFSDGLLAVCDKKGKWGFIDQDGNQVIPCRYDAVSSFSEGHAVAGKISNGKSTLQIIDKNGEVTARVKNTVRLASDDPTFVEGKIPAVNSDGQFGFLSFEGDFEKCTSHVKGIGAVNDGLFIFKNSDDRYGVMDYSGEIVVQARYEEISFVPGSSKYLARVDETYSLLNANGDKEMEFSDYKEMAAGSGKFALVGATGSRFEVLDSSGKLLSKETFAEIGSECGFEMNYIINVKDIDLELTATIVKSITSVFSRFGDDSDIDPSSFDFLNAAPETDSSATESDIFSADAGTNPFEWLSTTEVTPPMLASYSKEELRILRNAIYAMHGHIFKSPDLRQYFSRFDWYVPMGDATASLSQLEKKNITTIKSYE